MQRSDQNTAVAAEPTVLNAQSAMNAAHRGSLPGLFRRVLRHNLPLILIILVYLAAGLLEERLLGFDFRSRVSGTAYLMLKVQATVAFLLFGFYLVYLAVVVKPERIFPHAYRELKGVFLSWELWLYALPIIVLLPPFFATFTNIKTMVPVVQAFSWDPLFADWDRLLHGGLHPWEWLQPLLGYWPVTWAFQKIYSVWLLLIYIVLLWQTFSWQDRQLRMQFFLSFLLTWALVGSLGSSLFSSAGPVYFARVTGLADPYAPLLAYLNSLEDIPGFGLMKTQDWLWSTYKDRLSIEFSGISAMPSMHVAIATTMALVGWRSHRYIGMLLTVFALLIMVGSVHLAWHYAIDGYAGAIGAVVIWVAVGSALRRWVWLLGEPNRYGGLSSPPTDRS